MSNGSNQISSVASPPLSTTITDMGGWSPVWCDEFNGPNGSPVNTTNWSFDLGGGGWGNNELEYYTERTANAYIQNGSLIIKVQKENYGGREYTSARVVSKNKGDWKYGRFEIRAKLPYGQGIWPAIWMMPSDNVYGGWPDSGEIDIMELLGNDMDTVYGTMHYGRPYRFASKTYNLPGGESFADDYHVFTLEWEQGVIRWYVDGNLYHTQTQWNSSVGMYPAPFDQRFYLILNVAVGGNWPGSPNATTVFPQTMMIDYVRVYQRTSTPTVTSTPSIDVVSRYAGSDGVVQRNGAVQAVMDYFGGVITKQEAINVVVAYFSR